MLPESVYFLWCHNCNLKFYTILHEQISKHFLATPRNRGKFPPAFPFSVLSPASSFLFLYTCGNLSGQPKPHFL